VIDVRVGEQHHTHVRRIVLEVEVLVVRVPAAALEEPAFQQNLLAVYGQQVLRTGDGLRAAEELNVHVPPFLRCYGGASFGEHPLPFTRLNRGGRFLLSQAG
jgi:hypothetical protein